jgi:hypothetical protein
MPWKCLPAVFGAWSEASLVSFEVHPLDLSRSRDRLLELLADSFDGWRVAASKKYNWLYLENPNGRARVWGVEDERQVVGLSAALPRAIRSAARKAAWVLGDFFMAKEHRSLGPAIALQRAACDAVDRGEVDLWYDFPSRTMLAIYARMGIRPAGEMKRLVYPLKVDSYVEKKVGSPAIRRGVSAVGNAALSARDAIRRRDRAVEVRPFDRDFEGSCETGLEDKGGVFLERTADYLNWRYRQDPRGPASILEASGAFVVFRRSSDQIGIVDLFGTDDAAILRELVLEVIEIGRAESSESIVCSISEQHPWVPILEELGFRARDGVPFVVYARPGVLEEGTPWFLMSGDRDS